MRNLREELRNDWEHGRLVDDTEYKTAILQAKALGNLQSIGILLDNESLFEGIYDDGESERVGTAGPSPVGKNV